jgi:drug/metabolite transporter (DMT)-like permease
VPSQVTTQNAAAEKRFVFPVNRQFWIIVSLLTVYIIWGTTYLGIRFALESFPPYLLMGIRFTLAGAALFIFLRARGAPMPTRSQWRSATIVGVLLLLFGMGSVAMAEQWVSSGLAATLVATSPLWAMLFSMLWRKFPTRSEWIGVAIGLAGVAILSLEGNLQANPLGVALVLFATVCWSFGSVWMSRLDMPPGAMGNAAEMLAGGVILLVVGLLRGEQIAGAPTTNAVVALAYLTTFGSLATLTAYMYLLKTVSPAVALSYSFVNPGIALLLGVVIDGEQLTGSALIALPVILVGVAFVLRRKSGERESH